MQDAGYKTRDIRIIRESCIVSQGHPSLIPREFPLSVGTFMGACCFSLAEIGSTEEIACAFKPF